MIICPEQNAKLHKEYQHVMDNIVIPGLHPNIPLVTWESLLARMKEQLQADSNAPVKLTDHYWEFEEKYFHA